jgi:phage terminase Nu1 subunit (DNA packaging protein)
MDENGNVSGNLYKVEIIAQLFGVSVRRIQQLTQEGVISTTKSVEDGKTVRRYDLVPTIQKYVKYLSEKAYGKSGRTDKEIELREQKMQADIALKESQGELHRLKTAIAAGDYISIEEVKIDYAKFFVVFKKFAMSLPARVSGMLAGQLEPLESRRVEKEISSEISSLLNSFVVAGIVEPKDVKGIINGETKKTLDEEISSN